MRSRPSSTGQSAQADVATLAREFIRRAALVALGLLCLSAEPASSALLDRVVASVNDTVITQRELDSRTNDVIRFYARPDSPSKGQTPPNPVARRQALDQLIDEALLLERSKGAFRENAAERIAEREVDFYIQSKKTELGEPGFQGELARDNQTEQEFREALKAERKRVTLVRQARQSWIDEFLLKPTSQAQLDEYLKQHPELREKLEVQLILFRTKSDDPASVQSAIQKKAARVLNLARAGEPYEELVAQHSQHEESRDKGGTIELLSPTAPFPEFAPVFALNAGQVYPDLIRIPAGWCVVRVKNKDNLNNVVRRSIAEEEVRKGLKELREKATIVYDENLFSGS